MANRSAWVAGNGVGFTWTTAVNGSDLASMASGSAVLSTVADITNQTALDQWADVSCLFTIASSTASAGAFISIYLAMLQSDGTTYGDGSYVAGTQKALQPPWAPAGVVPLQSTNATTILAGQVNGIVIPPGSFRMLIYNGTGLSFSATAGNNVVKYRTYNQNLNA